MFSMTTIASSTRIPKARTRAKSTTKFRVIPDAESTMNPMNIERGMAAETSREFLNPKNMKSESTTRNIPVKMLFSSSLTERWIWTD